MKCCKDCTIRGVVEAVRGALGSSDHVLQILVDATKTPEAIRGMRNLMNYGQSCRKPPAGVCLRIN